VETEFVVSKTITKLAAWQDAHPSSNPNSISPVCAAFDLVKKPPPPEMHQLFIGKFIDLNANGSKDEGEPMISWDYTLTLDGKTEEVSSPADGWYSKLYFEGAEFSVEEETLEGWVATTPTSVSEVLDDDVYILFGNRQVPRGNLEWAVDFYCSDDGYVGGSLWVKNTSTLYGVDITATFDGWKVNGHLAAGEEKTLEAVTGFKEIPAGTVTITLNWENGDVETFEQEFEGFTCEQEPPPPPEPEPEPEPNVPCSIFSQPDGKEISTDQQYYSVVASKPGCLLRIENFGGGKKATPLKFNRVGKKFLPNYVTPSGRNGAWLLTFDVSSLLDEHTNQYTKVRLLPMDGKDDLSPSILAPIRVVAGDGT
jgi:hypothetical protein